MAGVCGEPEASGRGREAEEGLAIVERGSHTHLGQELGPLVGCKRRARDLGGRRGHSQPPPSGPGRRAARHESRPRG